MKGDDEHLNDITAGAAAFARPKIGTVESWKCVGGSDLRTSSGKEYDAPLLSIGTSARKEMLLERLPYMVYIAKARRSNSLMLAIKDMEKVTMFRGIGLPSEDTPDEADDTEKPGEEWATDKPVEGNSPRKRSLVVRGRGLMGGVQIQEEQKLVLSDDDIEDD